MKLFQNVSSAVSAEQLHCIMNRVKLTIHTYSNFFEYIRILLKNPWMLYGITNTYVFVPKIVKRFVRRARIILDFKFQKFYKKNLKCLSFW